MVDEQDVKGTEDASGASVEGPEDHHPIEDPGHTQDPPAEEAVADEEELPGPSLSPSEASQVKMVAGSTAFAKRHNKAVAKRIDSEK